jgi:heptosyltransferase-2
MGASERLLLQTDCRHFRGDRPCRFGRLCDGCPEYAPFEGRILVIKLAATGDVVRTTCLLPSLREAHPEAQITWVTSAPAVPLLAPNPTIDRLLSDDPKETLPLLSERFTLVICLDKEPYPASLASRVQAQRKHGVGWSPNGVPVPLSPEGDDYFLLGVSDEEKFRRNPKTYPELIHDAVGLPWKGREYDLPLSRSALAAADAKLAGAGLGSGFIGLNTGAGPVFAHKGWTVEGWVALIPMLARRHRLPIVLLGGPHEREIHREIRAAVGDAVVDLGTDNPVDLFAALVARCRLLVSGDTLAMHLAIAAKVPAVVLLGSTTHRELELFGRGELIVTPLPCAPCYRKSCDIEEHCMKAITPEQVAAAVARHLPPDPA